MRVYSFECLSVGARTMAVAVGVAILILLFILMAVISLKLIDESDI